MLICDTQPNKNVNKNHVLKLNPSQKRTSIKEIMLMPKQIATRPPI